MNQEKSKRENTGADFEKKIASLYHDPPPEEEVEEQEEKGA